MKLLEGKVALVTGAGRGIGKEDALLFAKLGARVVVNDLGGAWDGQPGADATPAQEVVEEIRGAGGDAVADDGSVSDPDAAANMVQRAVDEFGRLDILVNNAGVLRDRMIFNLAPEDIMAVLQVHVMGTFNTIRAAGQHWRTRSKAGESLTGRIINTSSASGVFGNVGQANYGAAKAGIASITQIASMELRRYGVTVNAVCPTARTRLTVMGSPRIGGSDSPTGWDPLDPANVAPFTAFLASDRSSDITGQVFGVFGGHVQRYDGWQPGPELRSSGGAFEVDEIVNRWDELFPDGATAFESPMEQVRSEVAAALSAAGFDSDEMA